MCQVVVVLCISILNILNKLCKLTDEQNSFPLCSKCAKAFRELLIFLNEYYLLNLALYLRTQPVLKTTLSDSVMSAGKPVVLES